MQKKQLVEIAVVFVMIFLGALYMDKTDRELTNNEEIARNAYGEGSKEVDLILNADSVVEDYTYTLSVDEVKVTEEEAEAYFESARQEINDSFPGDGNTMDHVTEQVCMENSYADGKVAASWTLSTYAYVDYDGVIQEEEIPEEGALVSADVALSCGDYKESYFFSFMVFPRELDQEEQLIREIDSYVAGEQSKEGVETLKLPEMMNGIALQWNEKSEHYAWKILLLEGLILILLPLALQSRKKQEEKKRKDAMMLDYPGIVSKFNVLIGAGMTIKQAWHIIAAQYIDKRDKNAIKESPAFEELVKTDREIQDGESERIAYQRFGDRIGIPAYRRFVRMIVSNLQKGNRGLCEQLEQEAETAFGERRVLARRLGEEAGTKLLFPMILMLGIVIVIVIAPAMTDFSI
jgi:hypothetical protein